MSPDHDHFHSLHNSNSQPRLFSKHPIPGQTRFPSAKHLVSVPSLLPAQFYCSPVPHPPGLARLCFLVRPRFPKAIPSSAAVRAGVSSARRMASSSLLNLSRFSQNASHSPPVSRNILRTPPRSPERNPKTEETDLGIGTFRNSVWFPICMENLRSMISKKIIGGILRNWPKDPVFPGE